MNDETVHADAPGGVVETPANAPEPITKKLTRWKLKVGRASLALFALVVVATFIRGGCGGSEAQARSSDSALPPLRSGPDVPQRSVPKAENAPPDDREKGLRSARELPQQTPTAESPKRTSLEFTGDEARAMMEMILSQARSGPAASSERLTVGGQRTLDMKPSDTADVRILPSTQAESYPTILHFADEKYVEAMIAAKSDLNLSIEHFENSVSLVLKNPEASGALVVFGSSGQLYRIFYRPGTPEVYDGSLTLRMRTIPETAAHAPSAAAQLAAAMYARQNPAGVLVYSGRTKKDPAGEVMYEREGLVIRVQWMYEASRLLGYIFEAENVRRTPLLIEQERFQAPGLIMAGAEKQRLEPAEKTYLYFIFQRGPHEYESGVGSGSSPVVDKVASD